MPLAASVFTVITTVRIPGDRGYARPALPTANTGLTPRLPPYKRSASSGAGPAGLGGGGAAWPRPRPGGRAAGLAAPRWPAGGATPAGRSSRARVGARGLPAKGPARGCYQPASAPGPERGKPQAEGVGREGEAGVIFHLSHLFRPARKSGAALDAGRFPQCAQRPGGFVPAPLSQTLPLSSLPTRAPTLPPTPLRSLQGPCGATARGPPGYRSGAGRRRPGRASPRALIFGSPWGRGSRPVPRSHRPLTPASVPPPAERLHTPSPARRSRAAGGA